MNFSAFYVVFSLIIIANGKNIEVSQNERSPSVSPGKHSGIVPKKSAPKLIDDPKCRGDLEKLCSRLFSGSLSSASNFAVLECVQNQERDLDSIVSEECQHVLWNFKNSLSKSEVTESIAENACDTDLPKFPECLSKDGSYGHTISCMTDNLDKIESKRCRLYIIRFAAVVFSDYTLVSHMTENCAQDIETLSCGRIQAASSTLPHSQGKTIECLSRHTGQLQPQCRQQILRLAELQSEDFHLDRALYFACHEDRDTFCNKLRAGNGRVYKCLMKHKNDRNMSPQCADQLARRQNLVAEDYKVSHGLTKACKEAINVNHCRKGISDKSHDIKLSKILLCLENSLHKGIKIDQNCQEEMLSHRQMILENFNMSPNLVADCGTEIAHLCDGSLERDTIHCLMKHAKKRGRKGLSDVCQRSLEDVVKAIDPAEDWSADPVLYDSCLSVKQTRCDQLKGGDGRVMRCLMRQLNTDHMTPDCEAALLEIQYFVARDWKLDPKLYKACHNESRFICHAQDDWISPTSKVGASNSLLVLPCLFRYAYHPSPKLRLGNECHEEVRRVMHERAAYVDLHPLIEHECMEFLSLECSDKTAPGEELACLQRNFEKLDKPCQEVVKNYTEAEAKDVGLNNLVTTYCPEVIEQVCKNVIAEEGNVMDCLITHKNTPIMRSHMKCRAVVEDFQVAMMEEVIFPPKFKVECYEDVRSFCSDSHNRKDVLECLSRRLLSDTLNDDRTLISKGCRSQIRKLLTQRHETIRLDSTLRRSCRNDTKQFCSEETGSGKTLECLRQHQTQLEPECHSVVFLREQEESADPITDVVLISTCQEMLKAFCFNIPFDDVMPCLMREKERPDFDPKCAHIVTQRMIEKSKDIRLVPGLYRACKKERDMYCRDKLLKSSPIERNGIVIECLKEQLPKNTLSNVCYQKVVQLARNAAINYQMDPILLEKCQNDMKVLCTQENADERGIMEECLLHHLEQNNIMDDDCKTYVAQMTQIQHADIHLDPILNAACNVDNDKYCSDKETGTHLSCLFDYLKRNPDALNRKCRDTLRERKNMYETAIKVAPIETIGDIYQSINKSRNRGFLLTSMFITSLIIFLLFFMIGRASSRSLKEMKRK